MTADDIVTAKLAEWEADMNRRVPAADLEDRNIARSLLWFVREVLELHAVSKVEHRCVNCECPWPCPTEQAARKWLDGEG